MIWRKFTLYWSNSKNLLVYQH